MRLGRNAQDPGRVPATAALTLPFYFIYLFIYGFYLFYLLSLHCLYNLLAPQARQDTVNTEKAIAWLTSAHAEERAARQVLRGQVQELQVGAVGEGVGVRGCGVPWGPGMCWRWCCGGRCRSCRRVPW